MLLDWFDTREAVSFGVSLAEELSADLLKSKDKSKGKEVEHQAKALKKAFAQIDLFKQKHSLNFYKKSKLANEFRWKLLELGHDAELSDRLSRDILLHISS